MEHGGEIVVVRLRRAAEAEQQVKLLQIARLAIVAAGVLRRFGCGAAPDASAANRSPTISAKLSWSRLPAAATTARGAV